MSDSPVSRAVAHLLSVRTRIGPGSSWTRYPSSARQLVLTHTERAICISGGETLEQVIHSLTALAGGRLAVILNEIELSTACLKPLLGEAVSVPFMEKVPDSIFIERLKEMIGNLSPFWNCLQFQVKVPDFNVLVAPWCNDPKVAEQNPQLLQMKTN